MEAYWGSRRLLLPQKLLSGDLITIPYEIAVSNGMIPGLTLNKYLIDGQTRIGPLVGIITKTFHYQSDSFGIQDSFFRKILRYLRAYNALGFVFTPENIHWETNEIEGWTLLDEPNSSWKSWRFPFPDVCYNRYFRQNRGPTSFPILNRMAGLGVKYFNTIVGNKWSVYKTLFNYPSIRKHLPKTRKFLNVKDLLFMINKYKSVYIKPAGGCMGQGIIRLQSQGNFYICKGSFERKVSIYRSLHQVIDKYQLNRPGLILIQQAIECPGEIGQFDIRILVQKDGRGQWGVTGAVCRVGGTGQVTSNLHTGGRPLPTEFVLSNVGFSENDSKKIQHSLEEIALKIAAILDKDKKYLGDLGMDFILDESGYIWFLEVNSKPGRHAFSILENGNDYRLSIMRPVEYALYLAGFLKGGSSNEK